MPNINEVYGGSYLKASDIDQPYEVTIESVEQIELKDKEKGTTQTKLAIRFVEFGDRKLVCNSTNAKLIAAQYGPETDQWQGKTIILAVEDVSFGSDIVPAIRVKRPQAAPVKPVVKQQAKPSNVVPMKPAPAKRPASEQEAADAGADQIPF
jgi:hypothetical protein